MSYFLSPRLREHHRRGARKVVRGRDWERLLQNSVFWPWQSCCIPELTVAAGSCTRSGQDQPTQNYSMEGEGFIMSHHYLRSYWQLVAVEGGRIRILQG